MPIMAEGKFVNLDYGTFVFNVKIYKSHRVIALHGAFQFADGRDGLQI
jgi:hypothetical protein